MTEKESLIPKKLVVGSTFVLFLLLTLPTSMVLSFRASSYERAAFPAKVAEVRKDYFDQLAAKVNQLAQSLNYSAGEKYALYRGTGQKVESEYYPSAPCQSTGLYTPDYYDPEPFKDLRENWVQVGKLIRRSTGSRFQFLPGNYVVNGTHCAVVQSHNPGSKQEDRLVVNYQTLRPIGYFFWQLEQHAHNRRLTKEELRTNWDPTATEADAFQATLTGAFRSKNRGEQTAARQAFTRAVTRFNDFTEWLELDLYQATIRLNQRTRKPMFQIGRSGYQSFPVQGSKNQTEADYYSFEETIRYLGDGQFKVLKGYERLSYPERQPMTTKELFAYLRGVAQEYGNPRAASASTAATNDATTEGFLTTTQDPFIGGSGYSATSYFPTGDINEPSYNSWDDGLLAVAVVIDPSDSHSNLKDLLSKALEEDVWGFMDAYSFYPVAGKSWKSELLAEDTVNLRKYDVLFINDYCVDTWDSSWSLTLREKQLLASWIYNGGSIYLSSAISNDLSTSVVKDQFFPAEWLTMLTTSTVLGGGFGHSVEHAWDIYTDTPEAAPYEIGEFAYNDTTQGLIPGCLSLGVIEQEDHSTGWVLDSRNNDKLVSISQTVTVPHSFAQAYFSLDYKKLTGLEDDSLEVLLLDEENNLVYQQVLVEYQDTPDTSWQTTGKLRLTEQLRPYAGQSLDLYLHVVAGENCIIEDGSDFTNYVYSHFLVDNLHLSFSGSNGMVPVLVYYDQELMAEVDAADYGAWLNPSETTGKSSPYYQTDSYNSRYFADHLMSQLAREGLPNVQKVSTAELTNYLAFNEPAIIIPAHPFPEEIYNGESGCPLLKWVKESAGVLIDQQSEPLAYFFSSDSDTSPPPTDWWDEAWSYRQELIIENPNSELLTEYQVLVELSDNNFAYAHCQADGSDLRFLDETSTNLPYWIETWEPFGTSRVWVKLPTLPIDGTTIKLYYGNSQATSQSDGKVVFPLFDDFSGSTLDTNTWSVTEYTDHGDEYYELVNGELHIHMDSTADTSGYYFESTETFNLEDFELYVKSRWDNLDYHRGGGDIARVFLRDSSNDATGIRIALHGDYKISVYHYEDGSYTEHHVSEYSNGEAIFEYSVLGDAFDLSLLGRYDMSWSPTLGGFTQPFSVKLRAALTYWTNAVQGDTYFDFVSLRKYAASEPTAMLGSEEEFAGSSGEGGSGGSEDWWNDSWHYRRELSIENPTTEQLTNYQVTFEFSPSNFDYSRASEFGDDLRFIDENNDELSYWLEQWDTDGTSKVWVNVPTLPADGTSITMYYDNDQAVAQSDGASTFYHYVSFVPSEVKSLGSQDETSSQFEVSEYGRGLHLWGNTWKYVDLQATIPSDGSLMLELTMSSTDNGELQGVGISNINNGADSSHTYIFTGSQSWGLVPEEGYEGVGGDWQMVSAVLDDFSGDFNYFIFANDDDADASGDVWFKDVRIRKYAATEPTVTMQEEEEYQPPSLPSTAKYHLHRKDQADLAILNYDLFQSVFSTETKPQVAFWSENFDDKQSSLEMDEPVISIALANSFGGYVKVKAPSEQPQPFYHTEQTAIPPVEMQDDLLFHTDVYVDGTGSTELFVEANNTQGEAVTLRCTLGEDNEWYVSSETNTFHLFIPFDDLEHPSELEPGYWNSLLLNLGYLSAASDSELDTINKIGFVCEGNLTAFDNFWIGYAGSTQQTPAEWLVTPLTPFTSDYPLSVSVLQQMNRELPGFDFEVFGESRGTRALLFKDEFEPDYLPDDDRWTEPPLDQWLLNGEEVAFTGDYNYTGSHSLNWNATSATSATITLVFSEPRTIRDYPKLAFSLLANTTLAPEDWTSSYPSVMLRDAFGATLSFALEEEFGYEWTSLTLTLDEGTETGTFNRSCLSAIDFTLPERTGENYRVYLDDLHFIKGLSSDVWSWEGQIEVVAGLLKLITEDPQTATWVKVKDQFGLGELSFLGTITPGTQAQFGLFGEEEDGGAYFHYSGSESYWWNSDWSKRKRITLANSVTLYNYPVYLVIPCVEGMNNDYSDLRFISGVTPLPYEITYADSEEVHLWLKLVKLEPTTTLHMYYNNPNASPGENPEAVWDSYYMSVVHLDEQTTEGNFQFDSTTNDNYFVNHGATLGESTILDEGDRFTYGTDNVLEETEDSLAPLVSDQFTFSTWFSPELTYDHLGCLVKKADSYEIYHETYTEGAFAYGRIKVTLVLDGQPVSLQTNRFDYNIPWNSWMHLAVTYDGEAIRLYLNGSLAISQSASGVLASNSNDVYVGNDQLAGSNAFEGLIDDLRFSSCARSADWIRATYQFVADQEHVVLIGEEKTGGDDGITTFFLEEDGLPMNTWEKYNAGDPVHTNHVLETGNVEVPLTYYGYQACGVDVLGDYAYVVETSNDRLRIYDISNAINPIQVGSLGSINNPLFITVNGNYAYIAANGGVMYIVDISSPTTPSLSSTFNGDEFYFGNSIAVEGNYAFLADFNARLLRVVDVSDKGNPVQVGSYCGDKTEGGELYLFKPQGVVVDGDYLYLSGYGDKFGFVSLDISTPSNPIELDTYDDGYVGPDSLVLDGSYVYGAYEAGLKVYSVSDPNSINLVGSWGSSTGDGFDIGISGNYACIAAGDYLRIIDISDPTNPFQESTFDKNPYGSSIRGVAINDNYVNIADYNLYGLGIVDISDPSNPVNAESRNVIVNSEGDGTASCQLLARAPVDLTGWDGVSDIPIEFTFRATSGYDGSSVTNFRLRFYDNNDDSIPDTGFSVAQDNRQGQTWINGYDSGWQTVSYNLPTVELAPYEGQTIYVAFGHGDGWTANYHQRTYLDYLLIGTAQGSGQSTQNNHAIGSITSDCPNDDFFGKISLNSLDNLEEVGQFADQDSPRAVAVRGNYAYIADWADSFKVIDISDPTAPLLVGEYHFSDQEPSHACHGFYVTVSGSYAYVGVEYLEINHLWILSIGDPTQPQFVSEYNNPSGSFQAIAVSDDYDLGYVADGDNGLEIIDLQDKANPSFITSYNDGGYAEDIAVRSFPSGTTIAYVADGTDGLEIIDVSDPYVGLTEVGQFDDGGTIAGVAVKGNAIDGDFAFLTDIGEDKVEILDVSTPSSPTEIGEDSSFTSVDSPILVTTEYLYFKGDSKLQIFDVSDPTAPTQFADYSGEGAIYGIAVQQEYAFVGDSPIGLKILYLEHEALPPPVPTTAPTIVSTGVTTVDLSWEPMTEVGLYYLYYKTSTEGNWQYATYSYSTSESINGLMPDTTYWFCYTAVNEYGESAYSPSASTTTDALPLPADPTEAPTFVYVTSHSVTVKWQPTDYAEYYKLYWATEDNPNAWSLYYATSKLHKEITELEADTTYYFKYVAVNTAGESAESSVGTVTTSAPAYYEAQLFAVVSDGTTTQIQELVFTGGFNPIIPHKYTITRQENLIQFFIDDKLVAEFNENLPAYDPSDPKHHPKILVEKGAVSFETIQYRENEHAVLAGDILYDDFTDRSPFPTTVVGGDDWWYVPDKNSAEVTTDIVNYDNRDQLYFEYRSTGTAWETDAIERWFAPVTDFELTMPVEWLEANDQAGRQFNLYLYHYDGGDYTLLGRTALIDSWDSHAGRYYVQAGTQESRYLSAPLSGEAVMTIDRTGSTLTTTIKDTNDQVILRQTDEESTLTANCLRLEFQGIWNEEVKVWIDTISLEGALPGSAGTVPVYHFEGDSYADPAAVTYGNGWLCFVKNAPLKPLTVNSATEARTTTDWLTYIIRFFADKIEPSYEFYWNNPSEAAYTPPVGATSAYAYGGELGQLWMTFPYNVNNIAMPFAGGIPSMVLPRFYSRLGLEPQLGFVDPSNFLSLDEGRVNHWLINTYAAQGASYPYPDLTATGTREGTMLYGSTLFRTTFDPAHWQYDFNQDGTVNALDNWQFVPFEEEQGSAPPGDWWDTNWTYRQPLTIENTNDEPLTNYQVLLTISDFPYEHAQSNGEDLRFVDETNSLLDYWIADWIGPAGESQVWVELPSVSAGATKEIMMYYSNTQASPLSNAKETFDQYVHFPSDLTDQGIGGQDSTPNQYSVLDDGRTLRLWGNTWKYVALSTEVPSDGSFILEFEMSSVDNGEIQGVGITNEISTHDQSRTYRFTGSQTYGLTPDQGYSGSSGDWQTVYTVLDDFSGNFDYFVFPNDDDSDASGDVYFKDIRIRKYAQNELSVTPGEEEELPLSSSWQAATTGMLYSNLTAAYSLQLDRYSLLPDPFFFDSETLGTNTSIHSQFYKKLDGGYTDDPTNQTKMGLDSTGLPVTSAFFYKGGSDDDGTWDNEMYLGTGFDPQELTEMKTTYGVTDWYLEFDYWVSQTTAGDPCSLAIKIYVPTDDSRVTNPIDSEDLAENFTQAGTTYYHALYNEEEQFDHYVTTALSSTLTNDIPSSKARAFVFLQLTLDENENQTAYIDNLRLTPTTQYHTLGVGSGYSLWLNGSLPANNYFDPFTDAKVVHYPFVYLDEVFSADSCTSEEVAGSKDYEFVVQLFDPTNNYTIHLHYFWSDDGTIYSKEQEQEYTDETVIATDDRLDFYLQRTEQLNNTLQLLQLDLLEGLNRLVQVSGIPVDREHTIHTLNMTVSLDDAATHLQIGSLAIEGVAPWKKKSYVSSTSYCYPTDFFGEVQGQSEITVLATAYLWSEIEQIAHLQVWSPTGTNPTGGITQVYLNGQFANAVDPATTNEQYGLDNPPTEEVKLVPGINRLQVRVQNSKDGAPFMVRLLTKENETLERVHLLNQSYSPHCYPMVSGNIGNGLVSFMGFDDNALSEPFDDDPLLPFLTNLLLDELEHRNLDYSSVKQLLMSVVEHSLEHKHQDASYDWENADDPFPTISDDDPFEIFDEIINRKQEVAKYFGKVMAASRTPTGETLDAEGQAFLNSLLSKLFHTAKMTGTDDYEPLTDSYWYPYPSDLGWGGDKKDPELYSLALDHCAALYLKDKALGYDRYKLFFVQQYDTGPDGGVGIKLKPHLFETFAGADTTNIEYDNWGEFRILSDAEVWVENDIGSYLNATHLHVYLPSSDTDTYSLLAVLNATLYTINDEIPFTEAPEGGESTSLPMVGSLLDLMPEDGHLETAVMDIGLGRSVHSYVDGIKMQLFQDAYQSALDYYLGFLEDVATNSSAITTTAGAGSLAYLLLGAQTSDDTVDNKKPEEQTVSAIGDAEAKILRENPDFNTKASEDYWTKLGTSAYFDPWTQLIQPMGEISKDEADKWKNKISQEGVLPTYFNAYLVARLAAFRADNNLLKDGVYALDTISTQTSLIFLRANDKEKVEIRWLAPNSEAISREGQSALNLGISKVVNYIPTYDTATDQFSMTVQTETHVDREKFSRAIYDILHNDESPYFVNKANLPIKLEKLTTNSEYNPETDDFERVTYYQVRFYGYADSELGSDLVIREVDDNSAPGIVKKRYDLVTMMENSQTVYWTAGGKHQSRNMVVYKKGAGDSSPEELLTAGDLSDCPALETFVEKLQSHPFYAKMKGEYGPDIPLEFLLNYHKVPGKDGGDDVYVFHLANAKMVCTHDGETHILVGNDDIPAKDNPPQTSLVTTAFDPHVGQLSVTESTQPDNNFVGTTHTLTGTALFYQLWGALKQAGTNTGEENKRCPLVNNAPENAILPFVVMPRVLNTLLAEGYEEQLAKLADDEASEEEKNTIIFELYQECGAEIKKFLNDKLGGQGTAKIREALSQGSEFDSKTKDLLLKSGMYDFMLFEESETSASHQKQRARLVTFTKAFHALRAREQERVHTKIEDYAQKPENEGKQYINPFTLQYQLETRPAEILSAKIKYGNKMKIIRIPNLEAWLSRAGNSHIGFGFHGIGPKNVKSLDYIKDENDNPIFSPIVLVHKLFIIMSKYVVPEHSQSEIGTTGNFWDLETKELYEGPLYDENGNPLEYNSWGNSRYLTRWTDPSTGDIKYGQMMVTAPQQSAVRRLLTDFALQIGLTHLIPNDKNAPLNQLVEILELRQIAAKLADPEDHIDVYGFTGDRWSPAFRDKKGELLEGNDLFEQLTRGIEQKEAYDVDHSFLSKGDLERILRMGGESEGKATAYIQNLARTIGALSLTPDEDLKPQNSLTLLDLLSQNTLRVEFGPSKVDADIVFSREYSYYNEENGDKRKRETCKHELEPGNYKIIPLDPTDPDWFDKSLDFCKGDNDGSLDQQKIWILKMKKGEETVYLPVLNFYTAETYTVQTGMKKDQEKTEETVVSEYIPTEKDLKKLLETIDDGNLIGDGKPFATEEAFIQATLNLARMREQTRDRREDINKLLDQKIREDGPGDEMQLSDTVKVDLCYPIAASHLDSFHIAVAGYRNIDVRQHYQKMAQMEARMLAVIHTHYKQKFDGVEELADDANREDLQQALTVSENHPEKVGIVAPQEDISINLRTILGKNPLVQWLLGPDAEEIMKQFGLGPKILSLALLGAGGGAGSFFMRQGVSLIENVKTQLWQTKIIEYFTHMAYEDTFITNIRDMKDGNNDGDYLDACDCRGQYVERYATDKPGGNETAYGEGFALAAIVWVTDYLEFGPGDIFEYINGWFAGSQMAKVELGLYPACMDVPETLGTGLLGLAQQLTGFTPPDWLENSTRLLATPAFKAFWFTYLLLAGSMISVITELIKAASWATVIGGVISTCISLAAGLLVQQLWGAIHQMTAEYLWQTNVQGHWTETALGDKNMGWKVKLYKTAEALYYLGHQLARPSGAFFEMFYLSSYFPEIGVWAGAFDSMLPLYSLTVVAALGLGTHVLGFTTVLGVSTLTTAGVALVVAAVIIITFCVLDNLKKIGVFKKRDPSTEGDR
ncbi:MAG: DUF2341 domain-containing protein [Candidatus Heimdallarchaeota archaeon]|nr:DUF2341 domain-containing protein [Candidatus Heimdallarchaeota archaeon]